MVESIFIVKISGKVFEQIPQGVLHFKAIRKTMRDNIVISIQYRPTASISIRIHGLVFIHFTHYFYLFISNSNTKASIFRENQIVIDFMWFLFQFS